MSRLPIVVVSAVVALSALILMGAKPPSPPESREPQVVAGAAESVSAPSPRAPILDNDSKKIGFQALLTDGIGDPLPDGAHTLDFFFYATEVGGVPLGTVLNVVVTTSDGIASAQVGPLDPLIFDGAARWMGITVDDVDDDPTGDELSPRILMGSVPYAFRVDRVESEELTDDVELGGPVTSGSLTVYSGVLNVATITADGPTGELGVYNPAGQGRIILHGQGQLIETRDDSGTLTALYGNDAFGGGAACLLGTAVGTTGLLLDGDITGGGGGHIVAYDSAGVDALSLVASSATVRVGSISGGGAAGNLHVYPATGAPSRIQLDGQNADLRLGLGGDSSGDLRLWSASGGAQPGIHLDGAGSVISITDTAQETIRLDGSSGGGGADVILRNSIGANTIILDGDDGDNGGLLTLSDGSQVTIDMDANGAGGGAGVILRNSSGVNTLVLDADDGDAGLIRLRNAGGDTTVEIDGSESGASQILLKNVVGTTTIEIDADFGGSGLARINVDGKILAEEVEVQLSQDWPFVWPDYVFQDGYALMPLKELEQSIDQNGHLPGVPSAAEVGREGIKLGQMDVTLLKKVEELTLYVIELNNELSAVKAEKNALEKRLVRLESQRSY